MQHGASLPKFLLTDSVYLVSRLLDKKGPLLGAELSRSLGSRTRTSDRYTSAVRSAGAASFARLFLADRPTAAGHQTSWTNYALMLN